MVYIIITFLSTGQFSIISKLFSTTPISNMQILESLSCSINNGSIIIKNY